MNAVATLSREERNQKLCDDFIEGELSIPLLADKYGLSVEMVRYIIREAGLRSEHRKKIPAKQPRQRPISQRHAQIGLRVSMKRITEFDASPADMSRYLGITPNQLKGIERGSVDLKLSQLVHLASRINMPLEELIRQRGEET